MKVKAYIMFAYMPGEISKGGSDMKAQLMKVFEDLSVFYIEKL